MIISVFELPTTTTRACDCFMGSQVYTKVFFRRAPAFSAPTALPLNHGYTWRIPTFRFLDFFSNSCKLRSTIPMRLASTHLHGRPVSCARLLMRIGITAAATAMLPLFAGAEPGAEYSTRTWQVEDGLPNNFVSAITQSPDGYLWVGTREGLARFDGMRFTPTVLPR